MGRGKVIVGDQGNREGLPLARRPAVRPSSPLPCGGTCDGGSWQDRMGRGNALRLPCGGALQRQLLHQSGQHDPVIGNQWGHGVRQGSPEELEDGPRGGIIGWMQFLATPQSNQWPIVAEVIEVTMMNLVTLKISHIPF